MRCDFCHKAVVYYHVAGKCSECLEEEKKHGRSKVRAPAPTAAEQAQPAGVTDEQIAAKVHQTFLDYNAGESGEVDVVQAIRAALAIQEPK